MLPSHCRHVSVHKVDYKLEPEIIKNKLKDSKIYKGTDYLILNKNNEWSIVKIEKTPRRGLFWQVSGVQVISEPKNTVFLEDNKVNVLNNNSMALAATKFPNKTVVVKGTFEHVSFYQPGPTVELFLLEVVPPHPPKLNTLVKNLLEYKSFEKPIITSEKIIDISEMLDDKDNKIHILPCNASGFDSDKNVCYLDECPKLDEIDKDNITLVGCELSLRIFKELYDFEPKFINICPAKLAEKYAQEKKVLVKCCKVNDFDKKGNIYMVPWGATYDNLELVFNELTK
jgi:hypothetical protein